METESESGLGKHGLKHMLRGSAFSPHPYSMRAVARHHSLSPLVQHLSKTATVYQESRESFFSTSLSREKE